MDVLRAKLTLRATRVVALAAALALGCSDLPGADSSQVASSPVGEGGSLVGMDSALKLFRLGLEPLSDLENAEPSMQRAVARFARIVNDRDTADLRRFVMSRREFAYLYYPTSHYTRRPTLQEPGLAWFLQLQHSEKGATRLMNRFADAPLQLVSNDCKAPPKTEGANRLWFDCVQRIVERSDTTLIRLFGGMIERNGRFKLFSYSNDL